MRKLFVLVPSLTPSGPVKGAVALCDALKDYFEVTLVALRTIQTGSEMAVSSVHVVRLGDAGGWRQRCRAYRSLLQAAQSDGPVLSLSLCLSADVVNFLSRAHAVTLSSIRGHLLKTYRQDYGPAGVLLAVLQFLLVSRLNCVIAMTETMARQFWSVTRVCPTVIGNFVDEGNLSPFRQTRDAVGEDPYRFVFVGRLQPLKCPGDIVRAVCELIEQGFACSLDLVGDGPLESSLKQMAENLDRVEHIRFHSFLKEPWAIAATADCMVLPSRTEGISRAALEALYLGVPCVLRDVDSNDDLIEPGTNGDLFRKTEDLAATMKRCALLGRQISSRRPVLTPSRFRKDVCTEEFKTLLNQLCEQNS